MSKGTGKAHNKTKYVTKQEYYDLVEAFNFLRDRILYVDIFSAALEKVLLEKQLTTRDEIESAFQYETQRTAKFREINCGSGDYEKRLNECKEWHIDPNITIIPSQISQDKSLSKEQKEDLANKFNLRLSSNGT